LRANNGLVQDIHPAEPNAYISLTVVAEDYGWFSVLNFKDTFYGIPLEDKAPLLFVFE
jgi:hypothetical protein